MINYVLPGYPTQIAEATGYPEQKTWSFSWDAATGLRTSETDVDNGVTTTAAYDVRGRPVLIDLETPLSRCDIDRR